MLDEIREKDVRKTGRDDGRDEGGVTMVMVAVALTALLGASALAIDVGAVWVARTQLQNGWVPPTRLGLLASRSWNSERSGDLLLIQKDGWYFSDLPSGMSAMHGTPWTYDARVPVVFMGPAWVRAGTYPQAAEPADIAKLATWGGRWALAASLLQLPIGLWTLFAMPADVQSRLMGNEAPATLLFLIAMLAALWLMRELAVVSLGEVTRASLVRAIGAMLVVVGLMTVMQQQLRPATATEVFPAASGQAGRTAHPAQDTRRAAGRPAARRSTAARAPAPPKPDTAKGTAGQSRGVRRCATGHRAAHCLPADWSGH